MLALKHSVALLFLVFSIHTWSSSSMNEKDFIHLVTVEWPPYYGSKLVKQGIFTEIVRIALSDSAFNLEVTFMPWSRALKGALLGKYEGLLGAYKTPERQEVMLYSNPVYYAEESFFQRATDQVMVFKTLEEFRDKKIAVVTEHYYAKKLKEMGFENISHGSSIENIIKRLLTNRADLIIDSTLVVRDTLNNKFSNQLDKIIIVRPPVKKQPLYITLHKNRKNAKQIISKFNQSLNQLSRSGGLRKIHKEFNFD